MKRKIFLWITAVLAAVLLLGSYIVKDFFNLPNEADIIRVLGFISLVIFTVYCFRGEKSE